MSKTLGLSFSSTEIVARAEFGVSVDPQGVLIENEAEYCGDYRHHQRQSEKFRHIGRYAGLVEVPYFRGETDDPFARRWPGYIADVEELLHRKRETLNPVERRRMELQRRLRKL